MKIPVCNKQGRTLLLDTSVLARVSVVNRSFVFQTKSGTYYELDTLSKMEQLLKPLGFELVNKNELVNLKLVKSFDPKTRHLYFDTRRRPNSVVSVVSKNKKSAVIEKMNQFDKC